MGWAKLWEEVKRNDFHYDGKGSGHDKDHCGGGGVNSYIIYHSYITVNAKRGYTMYFSYHKYHG